MKTCPLMESVIRDIAAKHGLDLKAASTHLRLEQEGYQPLVIEKVGPKLLSVTHYAYLNGDACGDPDILFIQLPIGLTPVEITQIMGYRQVAWLTDNATSVDRYLPKQHYELAEFADWWAQNIIDQHWLEFGIRK